MLILSVVLVARHIAFWRKLDEVKFEKPELQYFRRQLRRRLITSSLIGVVGISIAGVTWITSPELFTAFLIGWLIVVGLILLLAVFDMMSTRSFLANLQVTQRARYNELQAEIRRLRKKQRTGEENGKGSK